MPSGLALELGLLLGLVVGVLLKFRFFVVLEERAEEERAKLVSEKKKVKEVEVEKKGDGE